MRWGGNIAREFPRVDAGLFTEPGNPRVYGYSVYPGKQTCRACGRSGYPGGRWMENCRRGHRPCPLCDRPLTVRLDGTPRKHTRCPERTFR